MSVLDSRQGKLEHGRTFAAQTSAKAWHGWFGKLSDPERMFLSVQLCVSLPTSKCGFVQLIIVTTFVGVVLPLLSMRRTTALTLLLL